MNDATSTTTKRRTRLLESAMVKLFMRNATVLDIEDIGNNFRLITLGSDTLKNAQWTPGDKLQIQLGGWVQRTYTPMDWDAESGRTRIRTYLHSDGPGTQRARTLRPGDECILFGPRDSIDLSSLPPSFLATKPPSGWRLRSRASSQSKRAC
jgi:NADPH-dependent ferric siderophore reductase